MSGEERDLPTDRESPVGAPVIRGDESIAGEYAEVARRFDPDDPESLEAAATTVREFASIHDHGGDHLEMLEGAAACAALVRGAGSYKAAVDQVGGDATVSFIRKWARVHDLPRAIRLHVARGTIAPTAAKHIARVSGDARYALAWATVDHDLTVRQVRTVASAVTRGESTASALAEQDVRLGELSIVLPEEVYLEIHQRAALEDVSPGAIIAREVGPE